MKKKKKIGNNFFNNLGLTLGIAFKFYTSVAKGSKIKFRGLFLRS